MHRFIRSQSSLPCPFTVEQHGSSSVQKVHLQGNTPPGKYHHTDILNRKDG